MEAAFSSPFVMGGLCFKFSNVHRCLCSSYRCRDVPPMYYFSLLPQLPLNILLKTGSGCLLQIGRGLKRYVSSRPQQLIQTWRWACTCCHYSPQAPQDAFCASPISERFWLLHYSLFRPRRHHLHLRRFLPPDSLGGRQATKCSSVRNFVKHRAIIAKYV